APEQAASPNGAASNRPAARTPNLENLVAIMAITITVCISGARVGVPNGTVSLPMADRAAELVRGVLDGHRPGHLAGFDVHQVKLVGGGVSHIHVVPAGEHGRAWLVPVQRLCPRLGDRDSPCRVPGGRVDDV